MIELPFAQKFSPEILKMDKRYMKFTELLDKNASSPYFSKDLVEKIVKTCSKLEKEARNLKLGNKFEKLVLKNILERLRANKFYHSILLTGDYDFIKAIRSYGLCIGDLEEVKRFVERVGVQKTVNKLLNRKYDFDYVLIETEEELETAKRFLDFLLKFNFEKSPKILKKHFKTYSDYRKTIEFSKKGRSYHRTGQITVGLYNLKKIELFSKKEMRVKKFLDVLDCARVIGHEGLLGHQGHFIATKISKIPKSLKYTEYAEKLYGEILARFGILRALDLLDKESEEVTNFVPTEIYSHLRKSFEILQRWNLIEDFINLYGDLLYAQGKQDLIPKYLLKLTENPYYSSEHFKIRLRKFYSGDFQEKFWERIRRWTHLVAFIYGRDLYEKIEGLEEENKQKVLSYMKVGYWTPGTFKKYVDLLIKTFS